MNILAVGCSLIPTPWLLFLSSSTSLYLNNQAQLQFQAEVLLPFAGAFLVTYLVGILLHALARYGSFRHGLSAYYALGPLFMVFAFLGNSLASVPFAHYLFNTWGGIILWLAMFLAAVVGISSRPARQRVPGWLAVLGPVLILADGGIFFSNLRSSGRDRPPSHPVTVPVENVQSLPNIYHIVLDELQTELFELALTTELEEALPGFVYFPQNQAIYHTTQMSMASVYTGTTYNYDRPRADYESAAWNTGESFLHALKDRGYSTLAVVPSDTFGVGSMYRDEAWDRFRLFDQMVYDKDLVVGELSEINTMEFVTLWLYGATPVPLRDEVFRSTGWTSLDEEDLRLLEKGRLLPKSAPVVSALAFRSFLDMEEGLAPTGRYTLLHTLIPHWPPTLKADCTREPGRAATDPVEHTRCAVKLLADLAERLRRLGRFDGSFIVVHGDHGGYFRMKDGTVANDTRSRSLRTPLLVKPVGSRFEDRLRIENVPTTLLDIAPLIRDCISNRPRD